MAQSFKNHVPTRNVFFFLRNTAQLVFRIEHENKFKKKFGAHEDGITVGSRIERDDFYWKRRHLVIRLLNILYTCVFETKI